MIYNMIPTDMIRNMVIYLDLTVLPNPGNPWVYGESSPFYGRKIQVSEPEKLMVDSVDK